MTDAKIGELVAQNAELLRKLEGYVLLTEQQKTEIARLENLLAKYGRLPKRRWFYGFGDANG
jgi:hypothetical protein